MFVAPHRLHEGKLVSLIFVAFFEMIMRTYAYLIHACMHVRMHTPLDGYKYLHTHTHHTFPYAYKNRIRKSFWCVLMVGGLHCQCRHRSVARRDRICRRWWRTSRWKHLRSRQGAVWGMPFGKCQKKMTSPDCLGFLRGLQKYFAKSELVEQSYNLFLPLGAGEFHVKHVRWLTDLRYPKWQPIQY